MTEQTIGVLLMAYGGPDTLDDIPGFLRDIRGGRPTTQELIDEITENYRKIGGKSPLLDISRQQAADVERQLNAQAADSTTYKVYLGMRHWTPWIENVVADMVADGIQHAVALVLAPHFSQMSIAKYFAKLDAALAQHDTPFTYTAITSYHDHPLYIEALVQRVRAGLATMPDDTHVIFSAHSLPVRIIEQGDPYDDQLRETARLVAAQVGLSDDRWSFSYQSAGRSPEPWLGPQIEDYVVELAQQGYKNLLSCVVGFVADHVEVLFDIDIKANQAAENAGARLDRVPSLNDDPLYIGALVDLIRHHERTGA